MLWFNEECEQYNRNRNHNLARAIFKRKTLEKKQWLQNSKEIENWLIVMYPQVVLKQRIKPINHLICWYNEQDNIWLWLLNMSNQLEELFFWREKILSFNIQYKEHKCSRIISGYDCLITTDWSMLY